VHACNTYQQHIVLAHKRNNTLGCTHAIRNSSILLGHTGAMIHACNTYQRHIALAHGRNDPLGGLNQTMTSHCNTYSFIHGYMYTFWGTTSRNDNVHVQPHTCTHDLGAARAHTYAHIRPHTCTHMLACICVDAHSHRREGGQEPDVCLPIAPLSSVL